MWIRRIPSGVAAVLGWKLPVAKVVTLSRVGDGEPSREAVAGVVDAVQRVISSDEGSHDNLSDDFKFLYARVVIIGAFFIKRVLMRTLSAASAFAYDPLSEVPCLRCYSTSS